MTYTSLECAQDVAHNKRLRDDAEYREEYIEGCVDDLTAKGAQFYPFTHDNVLEAIAQCPMYQQIDITTAVIVAATLPENNFSQRHCGATLARHIKSYWRGVARKTVEQKL